MDGHLDQIPTLDILLIIGHLDQIPTLDILLIKTYFVKVCARKESTKYSHVSRAPWPLFPSGTIIWY